MMLEASVVANAGLWWQPYVLAVPVAVLTGFLLWAIVLDVMHRVRELEEHQRAVEPLDEDPPAFRLDDV